MNVYKVKFGDSIAIVVQNSRLRAMKTLSEETGITLNESNCDCEEINLEEAKVAYIRQIYGSTKS